MNLKTKFVIYVHESMFNILLLKTKFVIYVHESMFNVQYSIIIYVHEFMFNINHDKGNNKHELRFFLFLKQIFKGGSKIPATSKMELFLTRFS